MFAPLNIKGGFICYRNFFDSFFAFQKKLPDADLIYPPLSLSLPYLIPFGPSLKTAQIKLVSSCIYYTRTKVNLHFALYTPTFFGKQDNLSHFTFTHLDSSLVALSVILVAKVEVSISHSHKDKPLRFLSKSPSTTYGGSI